jgi:hypothetical protein
VSEVRLFSLLAEAVRASNPDFVSSQGAITVWGVVGVGGIIVFSSLQRRLSLLPASDPAGGVMVIGTALAMTGDALVRAVSLGMRGASKASNLGLGDNSWRSRGISKNRFL